MSETTTRTATQPADALWPAILNACQVEFDIDDCGQADVIFAELAPHINALVAEAERRGAVKALRDWMSFARGEIESLPEGERRAEAELMIEGMAAHANRIESGAVAP
jgi:hypothetical protein